MFCCRKLPGAYSKIAQGPTPVRRAIEMLKKQFLAWVVIAVLAQATPCQAEVLKRCGGLTFFSDDQSVSFTSDFPGGRMNQCVQLKPDDFAVTIQPELDPINDSAWYAFQVQSKSPRTISVRLKYDGGSHRYAPKISRDGVTWQNANHFLAETHPLGREVHLKVPVDGQPLWIAGQELLSTSEVSQWATDLTRRPCVSRQVIGKSVEGRELHRIDISEATRPDYVFIIARQHPPEVSGAIGMMHFVDAIAGDSELSRLYRQRYCTVVIPTVNPDGVAHGHWRANAAGVDLNRDWSHFTQPETRAVRDQALACRSHRDQKLCLFIDFHSTYDDVFYTLPRETKLFPVGFTHNWLSAIQNRFPDYRVNDDDTHNAHRSTSKAWVASTLGVTAITYEFGDETDRQTIRRVATGSAEEMMRLLVALPQSSGTEEQLASATTVHTR